MIGGTPPVTDAGYHARHPDWRHSYHLLRHELLEQWLADREAGKRIQVAMDRWVPSVGLTREDLERYADAWCRAILDQAVNKDSDPIEVGRGWGA